MLDSNPRSVLRSVNTYEKTSKSTDTVADQVEECVAFRDLPPYIPHAHQEQCRGEEACLEGTKQHSETSQHSPVPDESKSQHDQSESCSDSSQERARTKFSSEDGSDRLKEDICREEDQDDNGISIVADKS